MTTCTYNGLQYVSGLRVKTHKINTSPENIIETTGMILFHNVNNLINSRERIHTDARMIAISLIKEYNPKTSHESVGKYFNKHHSTITWNLKTHKSLLKTDKEYRNKFNKVKSAL